MNETATAEQSAIAPLSAVLGRDILGAIVQQLKTQPDHWHRMNEITQKQQVDKLREAVRQIVVHAVRVMVGGAQYRSVTVELEQLAFKDGIKGQFLLPKGADGRHELADAIGQKVLVVLANPEQYLARMDEVREAVDQMDLFGGDYDPSDDAPKYRRDEKEDRLSPARTGLLSWADLMKKMGAGEITKEQAEEMYGGPIPAEQPPEEPAPAPTPENGDTKLYPQGEDPLAFLDVPNESDMTIARDSFVTGLIISTAEDVPNPGLPELIEVKAGETLRAVIERLIPGAKIEAAAPIVFGTANKEVDAAAELDDLLERLFAIGMTISRGRLQSFNAEQITAVKLWLQAYLSTPEGQQCPVPLPEFLPRPPAP